MTETSTTNTAQVALPAVAILLDTILNRAGDHPTDVQGGRRVDVGLVSDNVGEDFIDITAWTATEDGDTELGTFRLNIEVLPA